MNEEEAKLRVIQDQLHVVLMSRFPVTCPKCKREFKDPDSFIDATKVMNMSALLEIALKKSEFAVMQHLRFCVCRAELFKHRDATSIGDRKRELFDMLLPQITSKGISSIVAKRELRIILKGEDSKILNDYGFKIKTNFTLPSNGEE